MNCRYFEHRLETLLEGALPPSERRACEAHLTGCSACRELFELAGLEPAPAAVGDDAWLGRVIARTSGSACSRVEAALGAFVDGELPAPELQGVERHDVESHLAACGDCTALVGALRALARELPRMAELRPDERFVEDVLGRTLPVPVRLRRFWAQNWPRWVRRPRFASEAAYIGMLALVLVFATPGSPLEAVPGKALETVRKAPVAAVESRFENTLRDWRKAGAGKAATGWRATREEALARARVAAGGIEDKIGSSWGTLRGEFASLLGKAEAPVPEPAQSIEERP